MTHTLTLYRLLLSIFVLQLMACVSTPTEKLKVPSSIYTADASVALLWIAPCANDTFGNCAADSGMTTKAKLAIHGSADRLDINRQYETDAGLQTRLSRIDAAPIIDQQFLVQFRDALQARSVNAVSVKKPVYAGSLRKRSRSSSITLGGQAIKTTLFPQIASRNTYNFDSIYAGLDVDYLMVMELLRFGVDRHFGAVGKPLNNPYGAAIVRVYLHEKSSGELVYDDFSHAKITSPDDWDDAPDYIKLGETVEQALSDAIDGVENVLFSDSQ